MSAINNTFFRCCIMQGVHCVVFLNTAALLHRNPTSAGTSHNPCHAKGHHKMNVMYRLLLLYTCVVSWNFPRAVRVDLATVGTLVEAVTLIYSPPGCSLLSAGPWALVFTPAIRLPRSRDEFLGGREVSKT